MAQLGNLLVTGASRLLNTLYCNDIISIGDMTVSGAFKTDGSLYAGTSTKANAILYLDNKRSLAGDNGTWLRINDTKAFTSGIFCGTSTLRTDGAFQIGSSGQSFMVTAGGIMTVAGTSTFTGKTTHNGGIQTTTLNASGNSALSGITSISTGNITSLNAVTGNVENLTVEDTLRASRYELSSVVSLGGEFIVAPSLILSDTAVARVMGVTESTVNLIIYDATAITSDTVSGVTWYNRSMVKVSGKIGDYVFDSATGMLTNNMNTPANRISIALTCDNPSALPVSTTEYATSDLRIMMYELYTTNATTGEAKNRPLGIHMVSYGNNRQSTIDVCGGFSDTPNVRVGLLTGLPEISDGLTPSGWGIYTDNGFFKGIIVSNSGKIGAFNLSEKLYTNNALLNNTTATNNIYIGDDGISLGKGLFKVTSAGVLTATSGTIAGWSINSSSIYKGVITSNANGNIALSTVDFTRTVLGSEHTDLRFAIGGNFAVSNAGNLFAYDGVFSNGTFSGNINATAGNIGGWTIDEDGLKYTTTLMGDINQIPFDSESGQTECSLVFQPGTFYPDVSLGMGAQIIAKGSTVLESVMHSYTSDGVRRDGYSGFAISGMGDFKFGRFLDDDSLAFGILYDTRGGEGGVGYLNVVAGTIRLDGYLYLSSLIPLAYDDNVRPLGINEYNMVQIIDEDSGWTTLDILNNSSSKFRPYTSGNNPRYRKIGKIVTACGVVTPKADIEGSATAQLIMTLPSGYRPAQNSVFICQGSGMNRWTLTVTTAGAVNFSRYGTSAYATCPQGDGNQTGGWLPFNATFMAV